MVTFTDEHTIEDMNFRAKLDIFDAIDTFNWRKEMLTDTTHSKLSSLAAEMTALLTTLGYWDSVERKIQDALDRRDAKELSTVLETALIQIPR
jgi:hypothetical protein